MTYGIRTGYKFGEYRYSIEKNLFLDPFRWAHSIMDAQVTGSSPFEPHSKFVILDVPEKRTDQETL